MALQLKHLDDYLTDLLSANRSPNTVRAYLSDLSAFAGEADVINLRNHFAIMASLSPSTRARRQAAFSAYFDWCVRQGFETNNPMSQLEKVHLTPPPPRALSEYQVNLILSKINTVRDRLLFKVVYCHGLRISEALGIYVEDVFLAKDDERLSVLGKGGRRRTLLIDNPVMARELRSYIKRNELRHGFLFRAVKNGTGEAIRYQSIHEIWSRACLAAGIEATIHQLRHSHATELLNDGVSLATIRKRLGHKKIASTMRYAELSDQTSDNELRKRRRK